MAEDEPSYIDYEAFLDPSFSPTAFANTLVLATNNPSDTPLDLDTPLSRVLFDVQEVDTHIDNLTRQAAIPLLTYTKDNVTAGAHILSELETQLSSLTEGYQRLEKEVLQRYEAAEEARLAAERVWQTVRLGRAVGRCLTLGRQLEAQMSDVHGWAGNTGAGKKEDYRAMVRAANTVLSLRQIFANAQAGGDAEGLNRITVIRALKADFVEPSEKHTITRAQQIVSQFSMSSLVAPLSIANANGEAVESALPQTEDTRSRATSALTALYLLSPVPESGQFAEFEPSKLISALQEYLKRAITSSLAGLSAGLATLPKLDRALLEVSARCQNILALEMLLSSITPPAHPLLTTTDVPPNIISEPVDEPSGLLQPLLTSLDTSSLTSYFWRSMASQLSARVQKIIKDGGVSARTLRSNRERVRDAIRECVSSGSQLPASSLSRGKSANEKSWEREAAVMTGSVMNVLGR